jgi:hypothetical protein
MIAKLELVLSTRTGFRYPNGAYRSERNFLDFSINDQSLWEKVGRARDTVSVFCREYVLNESIKAVKRLLLTEEADFPNNRRSLFICSECGDRGCGAITALVHDEDGALVWSDFGFENTYERDIDLDRYKGIGPFVFDSASYSNAMLLGIDWLNTSKR